jgi:hypothetical protein
VVVYGSTVGSAIGFLVRLRVLGMAGTFVLGAAGCSIPPDCPAVLLSPGLHIDASSLLSAGLGQDQPLSVNACIGNKCRLVVADKVAPGDLFLPGALPPPGTNAVISVTVPAGIAKGEKATYSGPVVSTEPWGAHCPRVSEVDVVLDAAGHLSAGGHRRIP